MSRQIFLYKTLYASRQTTSRVKKCNLEPLSKKRHCECRKKYSEQPKWYQASETYHMKKDLND